MFIIIKEKKKNYNATNLSQDKDQAPLKEADLSLGAPCISYVSESNGSNVTKTNIFSLCIKQKKGPIEGYLDLNKKN